MVSQVISPVEHSLFPFLIVASRTTVDVENAVCFLKRHFLLLHRAECNFKLFASNLPLIAQNEASPSPNGRTIMTYKCLRLSLLFRSKRSELNSELIYLELSLVNCSYLCHVSSSCGNYSKAVSIVFRSFIISVELRMYTHGQLYKRGSECQWHKWAEWHRRSRTSASEMTVTSLRGAWWLSENVSQHFIIIPPVALQFMPLTTQVFEW